MQNGQTANRYTFKDSWKEGIVVVVRTSPARERVFWTLTSGLDLLRWLLSSSCGPMRGTATVKVSETANFSYVTDLSVTECVCWRLKPWAMQDLSVEVAGMSGMTGGTTSLQNQNNLLFVNAAKNKRAFIVVCCPGCVTKSSKDWTNMRTLWHRDPSSSCKDVTSSAENTSSSRVFPPCLQRGTFGSLISDASITRITMSQTFSKMIVLVFLKYLDVFFSCLLAPHLTH